MFVLADIEWITEKYRHSPTQIAAVKVNDEWQEVDSFQSFVRPQNSGVCQYSHIAYTGGTARDFLCAPNAYNVLSAFLNWLSEDDIIAWWSDDSERIFKQLSGAILKLNDTHRSVILNKFIYSYFNNRHCNPYSIAEKQGIKTSGYIKHHSASDVTVLRKLMEKTALSQEKLLHPSQPTEDVPITPPEKKPLQYDPTTNLIHKRECENLPQEPDLLQGFLTWKKPLNKDFRPCECCKNDYRTALKKKNADTIARSQYTFVYAQNSKVFHKYTCGKILSAKQILGSVKYETALNSGRTPCKLCNPTPETPLRPIPKQANIPPKKVEMPKMFKKPIANAIMRHDVALKERVRRLNDTSLSETEKKDIYTLTQPRFAFWVGKGHRTFHRHGCAKLNNISDYRGFGKYSDAVNAGYTPCKICKPTAKSDVKYSIPISSKVREYEKVEDVVTMCQDAGYSCYSEDDFLCLTTPVGKWRIDTLSTPIKLEHINLATSPNGTAYHKQSRIFLSLTDTFDYIKRHDDTLAERKADGKVFVKLFA